MYLHQYVWKQLTAQWVWRGSRFLKALLMIHWFQWFVFLLCIKCWSCLTFGLILEHKQALWTPAAPLGPSRPLSLTCIWGCRLRSCCTGSGTCGLLVCGSAAAIWWLQSRTLDPTRWPSADRSATDHRWRWTWWMWGCPKARGRGPVLGQSVVRGWPPTQQERWPPRPHWTLCTWTFQNPRGHWEEKTQNVTLNIWEKKNWTNINSKTKRLFW